MVSDGKKCLAMQCTCHQSIHNFHDNKLTAATHRLVGPEADAASDLMTTSYVVLVAVESVHASTGTCIVSGLHSTANGVSWLNTRVVTGQSSVDSWLKSAVSPPSSHVSRARRYPLACPVAVALSRCRNAMQKDQKVAAAQCLMLPPSPHFAFAHRITPSQTASAAALVGNARRTTGTKPCKQCQHHPPPRFVLPTL